jgi:uncharacterized repeat protein (TIGR04042 family)
MPEMRFVVRWPDGSEDACYSPSTAIAAHLSAGAAYPLPEFLARVRAGLQAASERVRARYGFPCSRALGELDRIEAQARRFEAGDVTCLSLR